MGAAPLPLLDMADALAIVKILHSHSNKHAGQPLDHVRVALLVSLFSLMDFQFLPEQLVYL